MCGIIGVFNHRDHKILAKSALDMIFYRGKDSKELVSKENYTVGHVLHAIVGHVKQPLIDGNNMFAANCEIYNWKELDKRYALNSKNDAEFLFRFLLKKGVSKRSLDELDGVYAFSLILDGKLYLARDIIGVKPLWFSDEYGFYFSSEKKALNSIGVKAVQELDPRNIIMLDIFSRKLEYIEREFFSIHPENKDRFEDIVKTVSLLITKAVEKRVPDVKFGLLLSGGVDSTLIAYILKKLGCDFNCYITAVSDGLMQEPEDLSYAKKAKEKLGLDLKIITIDETDINKDIKKLIPLIESSDTVKIEVGLTFLEAARQAKKDGCKVLFSGLGSEEIFAGYNRHKLSRDINKECVEGLLKLHERDLYRDDVITMNNQIELRLPYLDKALVDYSLKIPSKYKVKGEVSKYVLRKAAEHIGLMPEFAQRKKKAAQYGSNVSKKIHKIARKSGFYYKKDFLESFGKEILGNDK